MRARQLLWQSKATLYEKLYWNVILIILQNQNLYRAEFTSGYFLS